MHNKKYVVIFTKTFWDEPPRIRHQVTNLLRENGYVVIFFQKASHISLKSEITKIDDSLYLVNYFEPLHHQLKVNTLIETLNNYFVKIFIRKILKDFQIDFIVNFNYDYTFLRGMFPSKKIITVINDDFVAQAKRYRKKHAQKLLRITAENSDKVLGVSYSLYDELQKYNSNVELLLPWAEERYRRPLKRLNRDVILFYGYINYRIDWNIIEEILQHDIKVRFIGPIDNKYTDKMNKLQELYSNFQYGGISNNESLYCDDILCSIIPYRTELKAVQAITINNKGFNLLSKGLPLVYPCLDNLIDVDSDVISKYKSIEDILILYKSYKENFYNIQPKIEKFLLNNYKEKRYDYFK